MSLCSAERSPVAHTVRVMRVHILCHRVRYACCRLRMQVAPPVAVTEFHPPRPLQAPPMAVSRTAKTSLPAGEGSFESRWRDMLAKGNAPQLTRTQEGKRGAFQYSKQVCPWVFGGICAEYLIAQVILPPRHSALAWRHAGPGTTHGDRDVGAVGFVGAFAGLLPDLAFDPIAVQDKHVAVAPLGSGDLYADDVAGRLLDRQVSFALGAPLAHTAVSRFPLPVADDFQLHGLDHVVGGPLAGTSRNRRSQARYAALQMDVIRHGRLNKPTQPHWRVELPFGGPVGQTKRRRSAQTPLDRELRVRARLAAPFGRARSPARGDALLVAPRGEAAPTQPRLTVLGLIAHAVAQSHRGRSLTRLQSCPHLSVLDAFDPHNHVGDGVKLRRCQTPEVGNRGQ